MRIRPFSQADQFLRFRHGEGQLVFPRSSFLPVRPRGRFIVKRPGVAMATAGSRSQQGKIVIKEEPRAVAGQPLADLRVLRPISGRSIFLRYAIFFPSVLPR